MSAWWRSLGQQVSFLAQSTRSCLGGGQPLGLCRTLISGPDHSVFDYTRTGRRRFELPRKHKHKKGHHANLPGFGPNAFMDKPIQDWWTYDGFGSYKVRKHSFPNNFTLRDFQRRRVMKNHAQERLLINCIRKADVLPLEIRKQADQEIQKVPRDSCITRLNRRCIYSGKARGIFHQFRACRMVWRMEADYNKISGVQRAHWLKGVDIQP